MDTIRRYLKHGGCAGEHQREWLIATFDRATTMDQGPIHKLASPEQKVSGNSCDRWFVFVVWLRTVVFSYESVIFIVDDDCRSSVRV